MREMREGDTHIAGATLNEGVAVTTVSDERPILPKELPQLLVVDDERGTAAFLQDLLSNEYSVTVAHDLQTARDLLEHGQFTVVLSDLMLDEQEGTALLPLAREKRFALIFLTGFGSMDTAVKALHEGAFDYLSKPYDLRQIEPELRVLLRRALEHVRALRADEGQALQTLSAEQPIVGSAPALVKVFRSVAKAALTRENVLVLGESGTGKELIAHAIHDNSPWSKAPFVSVNCCALTDTLLESELFGHIRGSFTGATQNKKGLFEEADGGTLFLDEVGDISLSLQVKLLRALQQGEIKPVGSSETRKVNVRVIAATHRDLVARLEEGRFREDLYYRLKVIQMTVPPLRERMEDLPALVRHFVRKYATRNRRAVTGVTDAAMRALQRYHWPGNVRELENAIGLAVVMSNTTVLCPEDFPEEILRGTLPAATPEAVATKAGPGGVPKSLEDMEKNYILQTLEHVNFNKSKAAEILGIDRVTLYRKGFKYGILKKSAKPPSP